MYDDSHDAITPAARELIQRHLRSLDHVEAALYLASAPHQPRAADEVAAQRRWSSAIAIQILTDLTETGLVAADDERFTLAAAIRDGSRLAGDWTRCTITTRSRSFA